MNEHSGVGGKVVIISGGSEGIGYGMATTLARQGAKIVIASRDPDKGEKAAESIPAAAGCDDHGAHVLSFGVHAAITPARAARGPPRRGRPWPGRRS